MKKTIREYNINNKTVLIRCDLNVPIKNGVITDDSRIKASLKTINYCLDNNAKVIILSHLGKVKTVEDKEKLSLYPVSIRLQELLNREVLFSKDTRSNNLTSLAKNLKEGQILLIENTRFEDLDNKKESSCDEELAKYWASLGEIFINDAYGTSHRAHTSNVGIASILPNCLGFLVEEEVTKLDSIVNEQTNPFIIIMGGAKVSDKIKVIENLITKCDKLLIGGGMAYTFLQALGYNIGASLVDEESISFCKNILSLYPDKIFLPVDSVVSTSLDSPNYEIKDIDKFTDNDQGFDIGPKTINLFKDHLKGAKRVIINGPLGVFENKFYQNGTKEIYDYLTTNQIKTLIGGGDSLASVNLLSDANKFYHVSTGGGATLEYLEGKILPAIKVITDEEEK